MSPKAEGVIVCPDCGRTNTFVFEMEEGNPGNSVLICRDCDKDLLVQHEEEPS